ncbi:MAG: A/G-specific adenine glycosylase [Eudoraea sp.]|nr:A/G-specific adenine glycosylase [Eudoraea sp.]
MSFSRKILNWYRDNKRSLPWRQTTDAYNIWLSEILLQQTRVAQGLPYYHKFIDHFPTVHDLANASEEDVLKLWQGLGYYSRARNLHATAKTIVNEFDGKFPGRYSDLVKLKGVGDYTASAIASISFNEPEPVVDGNVYRVLARYFGIDLAVDSTKGAKYFKALARELMDGDHIRDYNQGLMEFGALQCKPRNPDCNSCPLGDSCVALQKGLIASLPVKGNKQKVITRYLNYLVFQDPKGQTLFKKRQGKGIWQNLYEFPFIETKSEIEANVVQDKVNGMLQGYHLGQPRRINDQKIVHKLSHQHLHVHFWRLAVDRPLESGIPTSSLGRYPAPVLIAEFIEKHFESGLEAENG